MSDSSESGSVPAIEKPDPPEVPPLDVDGVGAVAVGTALWAIAVVVLLFFQQKLADSGSGWWLAVAATGFVLGLIGLAYTVRRRSAYRRAATASGEVGSAGSEGASNV
jgi:hypothetical protein